MASGPTGETYLQYYLDLRDDGVCVLYNVVDLQLIAAARNKVDEQRVQAALQKKPTPGCVATSQGWCKEFEDVYDDFCKVYADHLCEVLVLRDSHCEDYRTCPPLGAIWSSRPIRTAANRQPKP